MSLPPLPPQPAATPWPTRRLAARRDLPAAADRRAAAYASPITPSPARRTRGPAGDPRPRRRAAWPPGVRALLAGSQRRRHLPVLVDGQEHHAVPRRHAGQGRQDRYPRPGARARMAGAGRSAPRHHARPAAAHVERPRLRRGISRRQAVRRHPHAVRRRQGRRRAFRGVVSAGARTRGRSGPIPAAPRTSLRASRRKPPASTARPSKPSCESDSSRRSACARPSRNSTPPATSSARPIASAPRKTSPASACSTCGAACGTANALLPPGWVDYARTPTWQQPVEQGRYGAHWWLDNAGEGSFSANGYEGQFTVIVPQKDLIIVRHGATDADHIENVKRWIADIAGCFYRRRGKATRRSPPPEGEGELRRPTA